MKAFLPLISLWLAATSAQELTVSHDGKPTGEIKNINGVDIYHAYPKTKSNDHAIMFFTDIFGVALLQNKLLADSFARAGYLVLQPDYFRGSPMPSGAGGFNISAMKPPPSTAEIDKMIETSVKYAKEQLGVKKMGAVGYCFGGPPTVRWLAKGKGIDAGFIAHPGQFTNPEVQAISGPLTIAAAETDMSFNTARRRQVEDVLATSKATYQINVYSGASHGFAVRADMTKPREVYNKEAAFYQAVQWFNMWLKGSVVGTQKYVQMAEETTGRDQRLPHDFEYTIKDA